MPTLRVEKPRVEKKRVEKQSVEKQSVEKALDNRNHDVIKGISSETWTTSF